MADQLPPLQTLRAFEATARRLSMTGAADELHLTHGAVSRQIKALEVHLGVPLFRRLTRKIELTEAGASFFSTVTRLLSELAREAESIRSRSDTTRLVVSSGISFASKWLTPRLHRLMAQYPDLDVHLEVTDTWVDFTKSQVDVALRYGAGVYPAATAERIMNETVSPVCAPSYLDRVGGLSDPADLDKCQLIHEIGMTTTWERWFALVGLPYSKTRGPGYSHGSMSIEAAIRGEGVALGRSVLVAEDLAQGRLVALFPKAKLDVEWGYDLVYRTGNGDHPKVKAFRNWVVGEVQATT
ncbi:LysR family transcriptional regulator [Rhizobium leguminosarum bv. trifolii]|uniref:HTH-type transcriptional regulator TtuA n=1 Tax=Rhizobium leguminosarum bv. trifolii TaxID=386 RepID=A0A3E1BJV0_RHILT|nr:transcriptional regulator GcvA [Rhizobium leguminosarum]RFB92030.1 LysR family transcriptional regulator [Rhizobium leguminosarum bv. trifolii]RFB93194.1 LysR family transcriptional regulator [Rhizobium leguminosarum bv. trifolii]